MARLRVLVFLIGLAPLIGIGCASQSRPAKVGEIGMNSFQEKMVQAEAQAQRHYDFVVPKTTAIIRSQPPGALVEWFNSDGVWVAIANTPTPGMVIESSGKPELIRLTMPGYLPLTRWIAAPPNSRAIEVSFELKLEAPEDDFIGRR